MPVACVLAVHNTLLAQKAFLTEYVTSLDSVRMSEVCRMLALMADLVGRLSVRSQRALGPNPRR